MDKKYTLSFLVYHCRNLNSGICTTSFLLRSLCMFITVYHSFSIIPFSFFKTATQGQLPAAGGLGNSAKFLYNFIKQILKYLCCSKQIGWLDLKMVFFFQFMEQNLKYWCSHGNPGEPSNNTPNEHNN